MTMYNVEIDLISGQVLESFGVSEQNVNDLKKAFYENRLNDVFVIMDREGTSRFRIKDVTAICINEAQEQNKAGF